MNRKDQEYEIYRYELTERWSLRNAYWVDDIIGGSFDFNDSFTISGNDMRAAVVYGTSYEEFLKWYEYNEEHQKKISLKLWMKRLKN